MSKIAKSFVELIGKTPLLAATRFGESVGADANILAKLEYLYYQMQLLRQYRLVVIHQMQQQLE